MSNDPRLINAYKKARDMIAETPENKDNIINAYIDLVEMIDNYYNGGSGYARDSGGNLASMLKNPLEIEIYNNFQRYGAGSTIPLSTSSGSGTDQPQQRQRSYQDSADLLLGMAGYT